MAKDSIRRLFVRAAVIGALHYTWQLGLFGLGIVVMITYLVTGPDSTTRSWRVLGT